MLAGPTRGRRESLEEAGGEPLPPPSPFALSQVERRVEAARQDYLDALPIAAAVAYADDDGRAAIDVSNANFKALAGLAEVPCGTGAGTIPLLGGRIGRALGQFLAGCEESDQFEGDDGNRVGGRHFTVRLSRLKPNLTAERRCLLTLIDTTSQVETERNLRSEMLRDSLTGLANRHGFNEQVEEALANPEFLPGSHAILVLDMTRFSRVNECVGAIAGDELLITFARRLFSALRADDVLARTGGDEFGVLLRLDKGIEDALEVARRIKAVLSTPFRLSELEIRVDCAIGCALLTGSEQLAEEALRNAQFAMKRAKSSAGIQVYEPLEARAARRRFSIETELRRAIEADELTLAYQPLVHLPTGRIAGFEALARWNHRERGAIAPAEFIPVAEESGLILALGRWAIDSAAATLASWDRKIGEALPLSVSVNLSAIQIARDDVAGVVEAALRRTGLSGSRLTLELTESAIIQDPVGAQKVLEALKALDARVAMDDFGTGYTSLAYLQRLPIDNLKIDRSFVTGMLGDKDSTAIVRAVLSLAAALGMETTAEGIESQELADAAALMGCCYGQGYHLSPPLHADDALTYWVSRNA
jgi:diguanylate cyclase (GGDEF)-like protein